MTLNWGDENPYKKPPVEDNAGDAETGGSWGVYWSHSLDEVLQAWVWERNFLNNKMEDD